MKNAILCCTLLGLIAFAKSASAQMLVIPFPTATSVVKMLSAGKAQVVVTPHQILEYRGRRSEVVYNSEARIKDAVLAGNTLYLATPAGMQKLDVSRGFKALPPLFAGRDICALATDIKGRLWVGDTYAGAYMQQAPGTDSFELKIQVAGILSLAANPADTNVWVGTNVGLYRVGTGAFSTTRYAEEGYTGYELPDNVVEHLYADALSNVWVVMPNNISFKRGNQFAGELPTFEYLGDKENTIQSILALQKSWYLFVTKKGISYMPIGALAVDHVHASEEVHAAHQVQAQAATATQLFAPADWAGESVKSAQQVGNYIWFFTEKGGWSVPQKKLLRRLGKAPAGHQN